MARPYLGRFGSGLLCSGLLCAGLLCAGLGGVVPGSADAQSVHGTPCREARIEGEVTAGHGFESPLGDGLAFFLQPIHSGWILRVAPAAGPHDRPDYAELATPPYRSVSPLSVSTDFSFRAQDAVGWNPRRFRIAADPASYRRLLAAFAQLPPTGSDVPPAAAKVLAQEVVRGLPAEFRILDARLVPGTANQWQAAAAVASHFSSTAHTVVSPPGAGETPLGSLQWIRFVLRVDLPAGFDAAKGVTVVPAPCLASV